MRTITSRAYYAHFLFKWDPMIWVESIKDPHMSLYLK